MSDSTDHEERTFAAADAFDSASVVENLLGTWIFPVPDPPHEFGLIHFTDTCRAVQFVTDPNNPERRIPMRLWFTVVSHTQIRFTLHRHREGWLRDYEFADGAVTLITGKMHFRNTRPSLQQIPAWFESVLAQELAAY